MADVTYPANSGFYDSVNQDRLYGAEDMNKPYHRLVSNGVFATQNGTPSNDLRVMAGSGLAVTVKAGAGIFGDKWFELVADVSVSVSSNNGILPRIDSIIAQVDTNTETRAGSIVYREGTPASDPTPPALSTDANVFEYRLANITVAAGASSISAANIEDTRGSADCGWVTSLVDQVDTSVLFAQWQTAYQQYFQSMTEAFNSYASIQQQAWEDFFDQAQSDMTATNSLLRLYYTSTNNMYYIYNPTSSRYELAMPIVGYIPSYNSGTDLINLYINGSMLDPSMWSLFDFDSQYKSIYFNFTPPTTSGNKFVIECLKSVVPSDVSSVESSIQELNTNLSNFMADTGWITLSWQNGASAYDANNATAIRKAGNRVYIRGAVKGATSASTVYTMVSSGYYPTQKQYLTAPVISGSSVRGTCVFEIDTSGNVKLLSTSVVIGSSDMVPLDFCYIV